MRNGLQEARPCNAYCLPGTTTVFFFTRQLIIQNEYKNILLESWKYGQSKKGLDLYASIIMSSHVHMIIGSHENKLEDIMRDMKRHTAEKLKGAIQTHPGESRKEWMLSLMEKAGKNNSNNNNFQLWQHNNHPIELTTGEIAHQKLDYLH